MAHHPPAAIIGELVGMAAEQARNLALIPPGVHVGSAIDAGAAVRGAVVRGIPGPDFRDLAYAE
jgi:hypothetical protein